uniref:CSON013990 protein n=1 Tax=Culicoides sonorensis TaxID=179676 RepID=A0A336KP33_CULSO
MISSTTNGIERLKINGDDSCGKKTSNGTDTVDKSVSISMNSNNCINNCNNSSSNNTNNVHRDGNYYLKQLNNTRDRLVSTANELDKELEVLLKKSDAPEEIIGNMRAASGKARLLATKKIKQFEELCHKNLVQPPDDPFPTKVEDLEGFWDMVMLQVDDCESSFARIETYRKNDWQVPEETHVDSSPRTPPVRSTPGTKRPSVPRMTPRESVDKTPQALLANKKREEQRQKLAEMKRQYKLQQQELKKSGASTENGTNTESSENIIINH